MFAVAVNVVLNAPEVVKLPPNVIVFEPLLTPVPPYVPATIPVSEMSGVAPPDDARGLDAVTDVTDPEAVALIVWLGHDPEMVMFVPATSDGVAVPDPPCATLNGVVRPVNDVMFEFVPDVATPVTPLNDPPVILTLLAFCSAIVPRPDKVWSAFHAAAPVALNVPSAGVEWVTTTAISAPYAKNFSL